MPTNAEVADRIAGRKWAEEVLAEDMTDAFRAGFLGRIQKCFAVREIDPKAMSDKEARKFGRRIIGFRPHRGKTYDECPLDYLDWLAGKNLDLVAYLRSRRIREEREADDA